MTRRRRTVSGKEHPDTTYSSNNLGWTLLENGDWAAAEPYLKENLEINRKKLGEEHPRVAASLPSCREPQVRAFLRVRFTSFHICFIAEKNCLIEIPRVYWSTVVRPP